MIRSLNVLIALCLVVGLNLLSYQFFTRLDLTQGQVYTLSDSSKDIASALPGEVLVKVFLSENLPAQVARVRQDINDYIDEYTALSSGQIQVEYLDPTKDETLIPLVRHFGIPPLQLQVLEKDQRQTVKVYMGLAVVQDDPEKASEDSPFDRYVKYETIPVLTNLGNFEYDFTSALKKVSSREEKTIGFLKGHQEHELLHPSQKRLPMFEPNPRQDYAFQDILEKNYTLSTVSLSEEEGNDLEKIDTLVVAGPQASLTEEETTAIHNFVAEGGNALFLIDQIEIEHAIVGKKSEANFSNLLSRWGIEVDQALLKDSSHEMASFSQGFFSFSLPYPFWLKVRNLNEENAITSQLESFVLPWGSPLSIIKHDDVKVEVLASSSDKYSLAKAEIEVQIPKTQPESESDEESEPEYETQVQEQPINLDPNQRFGIRRISKPELPLVVQAQKEGDYGRIVVVGDSDFISQNYMRQFPENLLFFQNVVDALTLGDELISIRSKGLTDRPIAELSEHEKNMIRWGNVLIVPLLVVGFGLGRRMLRNAKKK